MSTATARVPLIAPSSHHRPAGLAAAGAEWRQAGGTGIIGAEGTVGAECRGSTERAVDDDDVGEPRAVVRTLTCERKPLGEGFALWRSIGRPELQDLDPFLSFDEFEFSPPAGFPDHPHRGFETVTYMLEGGLSYHDFSGHKGTINTGDVQWMTAGRGVVHAEMPGGQGVQKGINLWINLSSKDKMVEPRYQELASHDIPTAHQDGVSVKVIAGECLGVRSLLRPRTPALCLDVTLRPGARLRQPVPRGWSACAYVIAGDAVFQSATDITSTAGARTLVVFGGDGNYMAVRAEEGVAGAAGARVMLVAARPHGEAVVREGPFVMNTREEVEQAREDYRHRRNGFEMADGWTSDHAATASVH
ncbi:pirin-like protein [Phragmites australis]|uniref:pirin-like protein n=1 Tax=Phragmites australis TaxID=29695 RepID=UPI002D765F02|nr:pirin-like protein [Phragmites australis]